MSSFDSACTMVSMQPSTRRLPENSGTYRAGSAEVNHCTGTATPGLCGRAPGNDGAIFGERGIWAAAVGQQRGAQPSQLDAVRLRVQAWNWHMVWQACGSWSDYRQTCT